MACTLTTGVALVVSGIQAALTPRKRTRVEEFLARLPTTIPGASKIRTFPIENARHAILHVRDTHGLDYLIHNKLNEILKQFPAQVQIVIHDILEGKPVEQIDYPWISDEFRAQIRTHINQREIQEFIALQRTLSEDETSEENTNITSIIEYLAREQDVADVSLEHVDEKMETSLSRLPEILRGITDHQRQLLVEFKRATEADEQDRAQRIQAEAYEFGAESILYMRLTQKELGSLLPLYEAGTIRIRAGKDRKATNEAVELLKRNAFEGRKITEEEEREIIFLRRERALVRHCSTRELSIALYGGDHHFLEAIQEWNREHPEDTIALVEITPRGYRESRKKTGIPRKE